MITFVLLVSVLLLTADGEYDAAQRRGVKRVTLVDYGCKNTGTLALVMAGFMFYLYHPVPTAEC